MFSQKATNLVFSLPLGEETVTNLIQEATEAFIELQGGSMKSVIAQSLTRGLQAKKEKEAR